MSRPVIGISANIFPAVDRRFYKNKELIVSERSLVECVLSSGGVPLTLPVVSEPAVVAQMVALLDGLLLSGGTDVDPSAWNAEVRWPGQPERDAFETGLVMAMREKNQPILGVCRGLQMINVVFGGTLLQDIQTERPSCHVHRSQELYDELRHPITIAPNTWVSALFDGAIEATVNSIHHQAINELGVGVEPLAWSDDGLIEAIHVPSDLWTRAIQWHPEWDQSPPNQRLFKELVAACATHP